MKPGNILVNSQGVIKLVDFGLAKAFVIVTETESIVTAPGNFVGTLHYAAPDVLTGPPGPSGSGGRFQQIRSAAGGGPGQRSLSGLR